MANNKKQKKKSTNKLPPFNYANGGGLNADLFSAGATLAASAADTFIPEEEDRLSNPGKRAITGGLEMAGQGAKIGSMFGPVGTGIGAGVGLVGGAILGGIKGEQEQQEKFDILKDQNYANGGPLDPFSFAMGGDIDEINGPSHENGGVEMGPNAEVEGGEVKVDDYIFSDRLGKPDSKSTFADEAKKIKKKYELRDDDITKESQAAELTELMQANESARMEEEAKEQAANPVQQEQPQAPMQEQGGAPMPPMPEEFALGGPLKDFDPDPTGSMNKVTEFLAANPDFISQMSGMPGNKSNSPQGPIDFSNMNPDVESGAYNAGVRDLSTNEEGNGISKASPRSGNIPSTVPNNQLDTRGLTPPASNTPQGGIQRVQPKSGAITPQQGKQTLDKNGLPAMPNTTDPTKFQFGNEEKAMLASSLPALDNMIKGMKPETTKFDRVTAENISLQPQRDSAERQTAIARSIQRENARGSRSSGEALAAASSGNAALTENLTGNLMQSYMSEANANAQINNQVNQANTQISNQEIIANEQNRAMASTLKNMGLSDMSNNYQGYIKDKKMGSENARQNERLMSVINATFPNYKWEDDNGEFAMQFNNQYKTTQNNAYGGFILPKM